MWPIVVMAVMYEGSIQAYEAFERQEVYRAAEESAKEHGVPLLVIGCPKFGIHHGHGDVTLDINHPWWCRCPNPLTMDLQDVGNRFGAKSCVSYDSHVLEHLTAEQGRRAMRALDRVTIQHFHVWPTRMSIAAQLAPAHKSWPYLVDGRIEFEDRHRG